MMYQKTLKITAALVFLMLSTAVAAGHKFPLNPAEKEWLNKVEPIITHGERKTFKKELKSHEARKHFIDLFWLKRDPDLSTDLNEFKIAYLARYAHVQENPYAYDNGRANAFTMEDLYLLLGEPDKKYMGLDHRIMGFNQHYRSYPRTFRRSPEVWEYKNVGYGYPAKTLVVQFIATSSSGNYIALSDSRTDRFLENLRKKLILNEELS